MRNYRFAGIAVMLVGLALPHSAAVLGWAIQPVPASELHNGQLLGMSCPSGSACTAVGDYVNDVGVRVTFAEGWNGTTWAVQATPNPAGATNSMLNGVSCTSATACTATGDYTNNAGVQVTLAERWNGTTWTVQATPNPKGAASSTLNGVSCSSTTACTAVGAFLTTGNEVMLAERWNGTTWTVQAVRGPIGTTFSALNSVSCAAAAACTAVGGYAAINTAGEATLAEHWNGTAWAPQATPSPASATSLLNGVSCASPTACIATGDDTNNDTGAQAMLAERWNGTTWAVQATPDPAGATNSALNGVSCTSATACTAAGDDTSSAGVQVTLAERWNGSTWSVQATANPGGGRPAGLNAVSCAVAACVAAGSSNSAGRSLTLAEAWNGSNWAIQHTRNPAGATNSFFNGVSCPSATDCTAVGQVQSTRGFDVTMAERWNGTSWAIQTISDPVGAVTAALGAVSCTAAVACTAVGNYVGNAAQETFAERWNGTTWAVQATPDPTGATHNVLNGVSCTSATTCTATGSYQTASLRQVTLAERWNGTNWAVQATPNPKSAASSALNSVSCTGPAACIAAGSFQQTAASNHQPLAETWNGSLWTVQTAPVPAGGRNAAFNAVSCTSATACTAAGSYQNQVTSAVLPLAERWNGASWSVQNPLNPAGAVGTVFNAVYCASPTLCTAVGEYKTAALNQVTLVEQWNGSTWAIQTTPSPAGAASSDLSGISCTPPAACTAVGNFSRAVTVPLAERRS